MQEFIFRLNIERYRRLISEEHDVGQRDRLERMLADELAKLQSYLLHPDTALPRERDAGRWPEQEKARQPEDVRDSEVAEPARLAQTVKSALLPWRRSADAGRSLRLGVRRHGEERAKDHIQSPRSRLRDP